MNQAQIKLQNSIFQFLGILLFGVFCSSEAAGSLRDSDAFHVGFDDRGDPISSDHKEFTACEEEENEGLDDSPFERSSREFFAFQKQAGSSQDPGCESVRSAKRYLLFCCFKLDC